MNKYTKPSTRIRIITMAILTLGIFAAASVRLMQYQIVEGEEHFDEAVTKSTSTYQVQASRGDIVDRYGRVLATSEVEFNVIFDYAFVDRENINQTIHSLITMFSAKGVPWVNELPISYNGSGVYTFMAGEEMEKEVDRMKERIVIGLYATEQNCMERMMERYGINNYPVLEQDGTYLFDENRSKDVKTFKADLQEKLNVTAKDTQTAEQCWKLVQDNPAQFPIYSEADAFQIAAVRYTMEKREFSINNRYTFAENISEDMIINIKEHGHLFPGVDVIQETSRVYKNEDVASHLLGFVGPIYAEEYAELKEKGYQLNDVVGKSGIESVMEDELRGENGETKVTQNAKGDIISTQTTVEAVAGNTVQLSLDYEFQKRVQAILSNFMTKGNYQKTPHSSPGASAVVLDTNTGDVLACVSYPNYSMEQFKNDYTALSEDPLKPMYNRALYGLYAPGSSFKPIVGTAGLMEGLETRGSTINCSNPYMYWADRGDPNFKPRCLQDHHSGPTNILSALHWSCNIYFYDVGRRLGIDKINEYATQMGLGVKTGIEIGSAAGRVASKELSVKLDKIWNPGSVAQASIGQNYTEVTPISLACEAMTLANKGVRYETHLVNKVLDYQGNLISTKEPVVANEGFQMTDDTYNAIKDGMVLAGAKISGASALTDLPYQVAVKTGTPQTLSAKQTNNDFVAFTINGEDSIAVSCMIEGAGSGASTLIRQILDAYDECKQLGQMESNPQYPQDLEDILS